MKKVLTKAFFNRPALVVARELLRKYLVRKMGKRTIALMITETEAYFGFEDKGSHAYRGETPRNKVMFGPPGYMYVYFVYGMHSMLNLVVGRKGYPAAVLIRSLYPSSAELGYKLNGPGKLTKFLKIDTSLNTKKLGRVSGLSVEDRGVNIPNSAVEKTPRIGIPGRGEWSDKPWRFTTKPKTVERFQ